MANCPRIASCPLFQVFTTKTGLAVWKTFYCEGSFERCARWNLVSEGKPVPMNLLPNGKLLHVPLEHISPEHLA